MADSGPGQGYPSLSEREAQLSSLMAGIRGGSEAALDELTRLLWTPLVRYAFAQLDDLDASRDVVQETFIQVWQRRADWTPSGSTRAYLYRITRNLVIDQQRKRKVRARWALIRRNAKAATPPTPLQLVEGGELEGAYERALAALPPRRREVFALIHLRGLSHQDVARVMNISTQTVANQMSAALAALRLALEPFVDSGPQ